MAIFKSRFRKVYKGIKISLALHATGRIPFCIAEIKTALISGVLQPPAQAGLESAAVTISQFKMCPMKLGNACHDGQAQTTTFGNH